MSSRYVWTSRADPLPSATSLRKEREAREQLQREWARFHPGDRVHCLRLSSLGGEPTYTALLTCLELEREARNLRGRQEQGTTGEAR
jgi:hypothetical protein